MFSFFPRYVAIARIDTNLGNIFSMRRRGIGGHGTTRQGSKDLAP